MRLEADGRLTFDTFSSTYILFIIISAAVPRYAGEPYLPEIFRESHYSACSHIDNYLNIPRY